MNDLRHSRPGRRRRASRSGGGIGPDALKELQDFWHRFFTSKGYRENLKRRILDGQAHSVEVLLHHLVFGKPRETVDVNHQGDGIFTLVIGGRVIRPAGELEDGKVIDLKRDGLNALTDGESTGAGGL